MPFIRYDQQPLALEQGRTATGVSYEDDTLASWVAEVDAVLTGEREITKEDYAAAAKANAEHNAAIPAPVVEPAPPSPKDIARAAITAARDIDSLKAALLDWLG